MATHLLRRNLHKNMLRFSQVHPARNKVACHYEYAAKVRLKIWYMKVQRILRSNALALDLV